MSLFNRLLLDNRSIPPLFLSLTVFASVWGCGTADAPTEFLIYDMDTALGEYRLMRSRIESLINVREGRGSIVTLRGGGDLRLTTKEPKTEEQWRKALVIEGDNTPDIQYVVRENGVAYPWDFDSAMMLTLYHHLEKAAGCFERFGVPHSRVGNLPVYYFAKLDLGLFFLPIPLLTDNAAYIATLDAFLVPPRFFLMEVPLYANRGVVIHEYSHAVFNRLVHEDRRVPRYPVEEWPDPTVNELRSFDEGIADTFAALCVNDPDFLSPSIPSDLDLNVDRDLSVERIYDESLRFKVTTEPVTSYEPYELGSVVGSAIWALRESVDDDALGRALVQVLGRLAGIDESFKITTFFNVLVEELPENVRDVACELFHKRLEAVEGDLTCTLP